MSTKKSGGILSTLGYVLLMAIAWLGYVIYGVYQTHWINVHKLTPDDFRMAPNITIVPVPTTYYSLKNISEVIPKWHHDFHLYRLADPDDLDAFMVPIESLEGNVRAKQIDHNCKRESVICWPCFEEGVTNIPIKNVRKQRNWYASFARIPDELITMLTKRISFPFPIEISKVEHAFISNLEKPMVTAPIHGAPMLSSMAITFLGHKTWLVFPPDDYLSDEGIGCKPAATTMLPLHSPRGNNFKMYVYHAMPGDIMFFSENWGHTVYTHPGPNLMVNFRSFELGNIMRNPLNWWTACFNFFLMGKSIKYNPGEKVEKDDTKIQVIPEKFLNLHAAKVLEGTCPDGKISEFDQQLLDILKTSAGQFWDSVKGRYEEDAAPAPADAVEETVDVVENVAGAAGAIDEAVAIVAAAVEEEVVVVAEAVENQMADIVAVVDPLPEPVAEVESEIAEPIKEMEIDADSVNTFVEDTPVEAETQNEL